MPTFDNIREIYENIKELKEPTPEIVLQWIKSGPTVWKHKRGEWNRPFSLIGVDTKNLPNSCFDEFDLSEFNLARLNFSGFVFRNTSFRESSAIQASFSNAELIECDFYKSNLRESNFYNSKIIECRFRRSDLINSRFTRCTADRANFSRANLSFSVVDEAEFESCDFSNSILTSANFNSSNMAYSNFQDTEFLDTDIYFSRFGNSKNLSQKQVDISNGDIETSLPDNIIRPLNWISENNKEDQFRRIIDANEQTIAKINISNGQLKYSKIESKDTKLSSAYRILEREVRRIERRGGLGNISGELSRVFSHYIECFVGNWEDVSKIEFCAESMILSSVYFAVKEEIHEIDPEVCGIMESIIGINDILISDVDEWRIHDTQTSNIEIDSDAVKDFKLIANNILNSFSDHRDLIDNKIISQLEDLIVEIDPDRPSIVKLSFSFLKDILISPFKYFAEFSGETLVKFKEQGSEQLAKTLARSFNLMLGGGLVYLFSKYPAVLGPIKKLIELGADFFKSI